ncbi:hypothetical protein [Lawsonibacter hominis]|uniref:Uncharacterized protein n=1 Tax=Lawsonibacter hominis TaxID=2763053 RepID=A0A8J6JH76_9FIRM|nr:hypothetical protein [Lawsonibacter hominis]MBC5735252.1 hypothetical protein [Lawsonibacter hominis]
MDMLKRVRRRRRRVLESCKTLLIVLLAVSAVYLAARALVYSGLADTGPSGWVGTLLSLLRGEAQPPAATPENGQPGMAAQPVRIAIHSGTERFAVQYDQGQVDGIYTSVGGLLGEALASAKTPRPITEEEWRLALQRSGVYFDLLGQVPLDALYAWMGGDAANPELTGTARRLLVSSTAGANAALYYHNETDGLYYACETSVDYAQRMEDVLTGYGGNSATFAFEFSADAGYGALDPYVLIFSSAPNPRSYRSASPLSAGDESTLTAIRSALSFRSNSSYPIQGGGIMVREDRETLQIMENGDVIYHASEPAASRYAVGDGSAGNTDVIEAAWRLADATLGSLCGSARLYLMGMEETQAGVEVRFGYSLDGAAVQLYEKGWCARFLIRSGKITDYTLHFRSYEETGEHTLVLRERQAAAALAALGSGRRELVLCYADGGGDTVEAGWIAGA